MGLGVGQQRGRLEVGVGQQRGGLEEVLPADLRARYAVSKVCAQVSTCG